MSVNVLYITGISNKFSSYGLKWPILSGFITSFERILAKVQVKSFKCHTKEISRLFDEQTVAMALEEF